MRIPYRRKKRIPLPGLRSNVPGCCSVHGIPQDGGSAQDMVPETGGKVLAIGQKAAYFTGTSHFVNMVEDGGLYGYGGILELAAMMEEAAGEEKDTEKLIQVKGWGCCC